MFEFVYAYRSSSCMPTVRVRVYLPAGALRDCTYYFQHITEMHNSKTNYLWICSKH